MRSLQPAGALALLTLAACDASPRSDATAAADSSALADTVAAPRLFAERTAVILLADSASLARMNERYGADYGTVADDMMWYRAEAWSWLEERGIPIVPIEGRPPLRFRVAGENREFDYADAETADVVILYDPDREPVALAPVDVPQRAPLYFTDLPQPPRP